MIISIIYLRRKHVYKQNMFNEMYLS